MKENTNIEFIKLLQDEEFIARVKSSNKPEELERKLTEKYGAITQEMSDAADFIKLASSDRASFDAAVLEETWHSILVKAQQPRHKSIRMNYYWRWIGVAAAVLLVVATVALVYFGKNDQSLQQFADSQIVTGDKAVVITSDGTKHQLEANDMQIEYSPDGGVIALKKSENEVEKLTNSKDVSKPLVNQVIVPFGQTHKITLSDGTRVHLNSGSSLVFSAEFTGKTREVFLRGEGYFDVVRMDDKPFIVKTDFMDIKVLGTVFNVSAYKDEKLASTILVNGSVCVTRNDKVIGNTQHTLKPGQGCFYSVENHQSSVENVDVNNYIAWTNGMFQFQDQPLSDVVRRIKKYYNQTIQIEGDQLSQTLVSGKLVLKDDMEQVMNYLAKAMGAKYRFTDEKTYIISNN